MLLILVICCCLLNATLADYDDGYKEDFEIVDSFNGGQSSGKSQSIYPDPSTSSSKFDYLADESSIGGGDGGDNYDGGENDGRKIYKRFADIDLNGYDRISAEPSITQSRFYISPQEAEPRFTRSAPAEESNKYTDGYKAFLEKYFSIADEDDTHHRSGNYKVDDDHDEGSNDGGDSDHDHHYNHRSSYTSDTNSAKNGKKTSNYRQKPDDVEHVSGGGGGGSNNDGRRGIYDEDNNHSEYERIKALSQQQEQEIKQNPKHCKVVVKGDMKCSLCKNPETGAHSESCAYSSTPDEKKYAYVKERNYNSKDNEKDDDEEEDDDESGEKKEASNNNEKKITTSTTTATSPTTKSSPGRRGRGPRSQALRASSGSTARSDGNKSSATTSATTSGTTKRPSTVNRRRYSASYKAEESRPQERIIGLDPFLYGSHSSDEYKQEQKPKRTTGNSERSYDDYFAHVFPDSKNGKLQRSSNYESAHDNNDDDHHHHQVEFLPNYDSKKNVEKVLEEFKAKDWSTCKKEIKGDLTCYHCKDENGVRHEECMFISGSANNHDEPPKSSRLSYSETKEYNTPNKYHGGGADDEDGDSENDHSNASSKIVSKTTQKDDDSKVTPTKKKPSRKLVIRKRKAKLNNDNNKQGSSSSSSLPKPEDVEDYHSGEKKSIKRMVSYRIENNSQDDPKKKSIVFEHQFSSVE